MCASSSFDTACSEFLVVNAGRVLLNEHVSELVRKHAFCSVWPAMDGSASPVDFNSLPTLHRHLLVGMRLARDALMLDAGYRKLSLILVGSFLSKPDRWPSFFFWQSCGPVHSATFLETLLAPGVPERGSSQPHELPSEIPC